MDTKQLYDVTEKERKIIEWKYAKRKQLREIYLRDKGHPTKSLLFDTGIQRYGAAKTTLSKFYVPTLLDFLTKGAVLLGPVIGFAWMFKTLRDKQEHLYRTGQVSYADRHPKFV